jgi:hypothetical protein
MKFRALEAKRFFAARPLRLSQLPAAFIMPFFFRASAMIFAASVTCPRILYHIQS